MSIPLLSYAPESQNQRVPGYEVPGDEFLNRYHLDQVLDQTGLDNLIWAAYRQLFNEQQIIDRHRQPVLESQLRSRQITVRDFMFGLATSENFRRLNYDTNNNYRFVEMCIQRLLGRAVYNHREPLAWSVVLATKGLQGFIHELLKTDEYLTHFGEQTVPYQRRRILPRRRSGERPFARMARYDAAHLQQVQARQQVQSWGPKVRDRSATVYQRLVVAVPVMSLVVLFATLIVVAAPQ
ncbi:phycobilisome rod-core linker polypeptide CpcG [Synechococcales cyanobacterium C]|uniref:Phycobilisome rod-core linker polypeptide CpcG n=1 Tax=Petrachloros mirabilis ULC683 TaxID=2781853 RepID=A0A8K2A2J6_9CYAN|nr:phycobilisome rod-core linker polypeptide [Petrachloros mirabilis]NCJ08392.1 phycobilisome rod-core linker polypeptide CpcG [Petrachloros mirabilis ULC683]